MSTDTNNENDNNLDTDYSNEKYRRNDAHFKDDESKKVLVPQCDFI